MTGLESVEKELRREWWVNHGHDFFALYGDDGEMQCGQCPADFKRDPIERLRELVFVGRAARAQKAMEPVMIYVVFSPGDPMPIMSARTAEVAEQYANALARLPGGHPLRTADAIVDELPLLSVLPAPLREVLADSDPGDPRA